MRSRGRRPKSAKARSRGEWGTRRMQGYGDLASARVLEKMSRDRRPCRLGWKLGCGYWRERTEGGLLHGICGWEKGDDRDVQFLGEGLRAVGDLGDLLHANAFAPAAAGRELMWSTTMKRPSLSSRLKALFRAPMRTRRGGR